MKAWSKSQVYFGTREVPIQKRNNIVRLPEEYYLEVYRNRNGENARQFIGVAGWARWREYSVDPSRRSPYVGLFDAKFALDTNYDLSEILPECDFERLQISGDHINLPEWLRHHSRLAYRVCVIGAGSHIELWNPIEWRAYCGKNPMPPKRKSKIFLLFRD